MPSGQQLTTGGAVTLAVFVVLCCGSCGGLAWWVNTEGVVWDRAQKKDTIERYEDYLQRFPEGEHAERARLRLATLRKVEEELWSKVGDPPSEAALKAYLARFPEGPHAERAESLLEDGEVRRGAQESQQGMGKTVEEVREMEAVEEKVMESIYEPAPGGP